jgi:predicted N-acetyltransferase YhbS
LKVSVRFEEAADAADVRDVHERAFEGPLEARIVDALRGSPDSI